MTDPTTIGPAQHDRPPWLQGMKYRTNGLPPFRLMIWTGSGRPDDVIDMDDEAEVKLRVPPGRRCHWELFDAEGGRIDHGDVP